jgi:hypothetical protein
MVVTTIDPLAALLTGDRNYFMIPGSTETEAARRADDDKLRRKHEITGESKLLPGKRTRPLRKERVFLFLRLKREPRRVFGGGAKSCERKLFCRDHAEQPARRIRCALAGKIANSAKKESYSSTEPSTA